MTTLDLTPLSDDAMPGGHGGYWVGGHCHDPGVLMGLADELDKERWQASIWSLGEYRYEIDEVIYERRSPALYRGEQRVTLIKVVEDLAPSP